MVFRAVNIYTTAAEKVGKYQKSTMVKLYCTAKRRKRHFCECLKILRTVILRNTSYNQLIVYKVNVTFYVCSYFIFYIFCILYISVYVDILYREEVKKAKKKKTNKLWQTNFPHAQALRLKQICTESEDFGANCDILLAERGYKKEAY